jgi:hypothetical protein
MRTKFWFESLRGRDHSEDQGVDGDNIKIDLKEIEFGMWIGFVWIRLGTGGGLL